jgi:hypothetical protein
MLVSIPPSLTLLLVVTLWLPAWDELTTYYDLPLGVQEDKPLVRAVMEYVGAGGVFLRIKGLAYGSLLFLRACRQYVLCGKELPLTAVSYFVFSFLPFFLLLFFV